MLASVSVRCFLFRDAERWKEKDRKTDSQNLRTSSERHCHGNQLNMGTNKNVKWEREREREGERETSKQNVYIWEDKIRKERKKSTLTNWSSDPYRSIIRIIPAYSINISRSSLSPPPTTLPSASPPPLPLLPPPPPSPPPPSPPPAPLVVNIDSPVFLFGMIIIRFRPFRWKFPAEPNKARASGKTSENVTDSTFLQVSHHRSAANEPPGYFRFSHVQ